MKLVVSQLRQTSRAIILVVVTVLMLACSGVEEKRGQYRQSQTIEPLKIPPGLQAPTSDAALQLPQVKNDAAVGVDAKPPVNLPEDALVEPEASPSEKKVSKPARKRDFLDN